MIDTLLHGYKGWAAVKLVVAALTMVSFNPPALAQTNNVLITVSSPEDPQICAIKERLHTVFSLVPRTEVYRSNSSQDEEVPLASELMLGIKLALSRDENELIKVRLVSNGADKTIELDPNSSLEPQLKPALPFQLAKFLDRTSKPTNKDPLLQAICAKNSTVAYQLAGAAPNLSLLRTKWQPPIDNKSGTLIDWARGRALLRTKQYPAAIKSLRKVVLNLQATENAPLWYHSNTSGAIASHVKIIKDKAIIYDEGHFMALIPKTGEILWRTKTGYGSPRIIAAGQDKLLAVTKKGLHCLDLNTGRKNWFVNLPSAADEVAISNGYIYAAGPRTLLAADLKSGRIIWKTKSHQAYRAGPVLFSDSLAIPMTTKLVFTNPQDGRRTHELPFDDEISGPVVRTSPKQLWVLVGGKRIATVTPALKLGSTASAERIHPKTKYWIQNAMGVDWPPHAQGDTLLIAARHSRRGPYVARLDMGSKHSNKRVYWGGVAPLRLLDDYRSFAYFGQNGRSLNVRETSGRRRWTRKIGLGPHELYVSPGLIWTTERNQILAFHQESGELHSRIVLDEPIVSMDLMGRDGVAIMESGSIYGFSAHRTPEWDFWLTESRLDLAEAYSHTGERKRANRLIDEVLNKKPWSNRANVLKNINQLNQNRGKKLSSLLQLKRQLPKLSPYRAAVQDELRASTGLLKNFETNVDLRHAKLFHHDRIIAQASNEIQVINDPQTKWTFTGTASKALGPKHLIIEDQILDAANGKRLAKLSREQFTEDYPVLYRQSSSSLSMHTVDGRTLWQTSHDKAVRQILGQTREYVAFTIPTSSSTSSPKAKEFRVEVRSKTNGNLLWTRPFPYHFTNAAFSGPNLLLQGFKKLIGVSVKDGTTLFQANPPSTEKPSVFADDESWLLQTSKRIMRLSSRSGKVMGVYRFKQAPRSVCHAAQARSIFIVNADGQLLSLGLGKMRESARIPELRFDHVNCRNDKVLAHSKREFFLFSAKQGLRSSP